MRNDSRLSEKSSSWVNTRRTVRVSARHKTSRKDIVEPDHSCGSGPHEITNSAVVAIGDPTILCERVSCEGAKLLERPWDPVRSPIEGIKFNVRKTQHACETLSKGGFADATSANHNHTRHRCLHTIHQFTCAVNLPGRPAFALAAAFPAFAFWRSGRPKRVGCRARCQAANILNIDPVFAQEVARVL
jgi:hypothetical protein